MILVVKLRVALFAEYCLDYYLTFYQQRVKWVSWYLCYIHCRWVVRNEDDVCRLTLLDTGPQSTPRGRRRWLHLHSRCDSPHVISLFSREEMGIRVAPRALLKACLTPSSLHAALLPTRLRMENLFFHRKLPASQKVQEAIFKSIWRKKRKDLTRKRQEK